MGDSVPPVWAMKQVGSRSDVGDEPDKCSWCSKHHYQSQWLHSAISELDHCTREMQNLMQQEDGDTFSQRAETYYHKRPELARRVDHFRKSYHLLAEFCGHLSIRSSFRPAAPSRLQIDTFAKAAGKVFGDGHGDINHDSSDPNPELFASEPDHDGSDHKKSSDMTSVFDDASTLTADTEKLPQKTSSCSGGSGGSETTEECDLGFDSMEERISCSEKMSRIVEDTVSELVRRNEDKREAKRKLERQIESLVEENAALRRQLGEALSENRRLLLCKRSSGGPKRSRWARVKYSLLRSCLVHD